MLKLRKNKIVTQLVALSALMVILTGCAATPAEETRTDEQLIEEGWVKNPEEQGYVLESEIETPEAAPALAELPAPLVDENAEAKYAATNSSITVENLDQYLNRPDVLYIDIRDYKDYAKKHFKNFGIQPYFGYIFNAEAHTNPEMIQLYGGTPDAPVDVYNESDSILNVMFPKDKTLFIICEKGGRVTQMMQILEAKGYDMSKIYNIGGVGQYTDKKYDEFLTDSYELGLESTYSIEGVTRK